MKITMLVENTSSVPAIKTQHGLSVYIETAKHKVLFDTAWDGLCLRNAEALGIDLKAVDTLVISHGHYDHGKGLRDFMAYNGKAKVYIRKAAFEPHYIKVLWAKVSIGLDAGLRDDPRIVFTDDVHRIDDELLLFADVGGKQLLSKSAKKLLKKENGGFVQDDFAHEQSLLVTENGEGVLFAGCAHRGIYNIVEAAQRHCGSLSTCVGGFHLYNPPTRRYERKELIEALANRLNETRVRFYTCHCTGQKAYEIMKDIMGDRVSYIRAGASMELPQLP